MINFKISKFDNGISESTRNTRADFNSEVGNFDIYSDQFQITPFRDTEAEETASGDIKDFRITDVDIVTYSGSTYLIGLGRESSVSIALKFFLKSSTSNIDSTWQAQGVSTRAVVPGTLVIFRGDAYALTTNGTTTFYLEKFNGASTPTTIGSFSTSYVPSVVPRPIVHPLDNILYIAAANQIVTYEPVGGINTSANTVPVDQEITSLTDYSGYLAIAVKPKNGVGESYAYLWGRDATLTTYQEKINFGVANLMVLDNIDGALFGVSIEQTTAYSLSVDKKLTIRGYSGGYAQIIKEINVDSVNLYNFKRKKDSKLYFYVDGSDSLFAFYKNKSGSFVVTKERYIANGNTPSNLRGFSFVGDYLFVCYDISPTTGYTYRTSNTESFTSVSKYITTENIGVDTSDVSKEKQLRGVYVMWESTAVNSSITLSYSVNNGAYVDLITDTQNTGVYTIETMRELSGNSLQAYRTIKFKVTSTRGAKIKEIGGRYETLKTTT